MDLSELTARYARQMNFKPSTMETVALRTLSDYGKPLQDLTNADWQKVFASVRSGNIIYFSRLRHVYVAFLEWAKAEGIDCDASLEALKNIGLGLKDVSFQPDAYFRDFEDFLQKFNKVAQDESGSYGKWQTLLVVLVLLWFGVPLEDVFGLLKTSLLYSEDNGYLINLPLDTMIVIKNPVAVKLLHDYAESPGYYSQSQSSRILAYADTSAFLRTTRGPLTRASTYVIVSDFNKIVLEAGETWQISLRYFPENASFLWALKHCQSHRIRIATQPAFRYRMLFCHLFGIPDPVNDPEHYDHAALRIKYARFIVWLRCYYPEALEE